MPSELDAPLSLEGSRVHVGDGAIALNRLICRSAPKVVGANTLPAVRIWPLLRMIRLFAPPPEAFPNATTPPGANATSGAPLAWKWPTEETPSVPTAQMEPSAASCSPLHPPETVLNTAP